MTPPLSLNPLTDLHELVRFQFMVNALWAGATVAVLAAVAGWFMILRSQAFAGHSLAVMAFPGATGAALIGLPATLGYYLACGAAALAMSGARSRGSHRAARPLRSAPCKPLGWRPAFSFCRSTPSCSAAPRRCCSAPSSASPRVRWSAWRRSRWSA